MKVDAETGNVIPYAGAGFQIYRPDGELVTMTFTYPSPVEIDTFYTDEDGCFVTPERLEYGTGYYLIEVMAPYGYTLDPNPVYFDVTEDNSSEEGGVTVITVEKTNMAQKGTIEVSKSGEVYFGVNVTGGVDENGNELPIIYQPVYEVRGLSGATYSIRAAEDVITPDGTVRYAKGEIVDTIKTGEDGIAVSKELYLGKYEVEEIEAPYGMVLSGEIHAVELTYAGQNVEVTETATSFYNERQRVEITLAKILETDKLFGIGTNGEIKNISFAFLKREYGWGGSYPAIVGAGIDEQHDGKGIKLSRRSRDGESSVLLKWAQVESRIVELIRQDRYLNPKEQERYPAWLEAQEARRAELAQERANREILSTPPAPAVPEQPEKEYVYHLGDSVFIGADEYEILSFDEERVMLYDTKFPLINKEMSRSEFDSKVRENPMNDHLLAPAVAQPETEKADADSAAPVNTQSDVMQTAQQLINEFCQSEYEEDADFSNLREIGVAYTTVGNDDLETQINVNLEDFSVDRFVAGVLVESRKYGTLEELIEKELEGLDFNDLTEYTDDQLESVREKLNPTQSIEPQAPVTPAWEKQPKNKVKTFDLHPEIPMSERHTFDLAANEIEEVGKKERFRRNLMAIQLLKKCQAENRFATPEEQQILSKYVGWGGIPEAFDENNSSWATEYLELSTVLTPDEYVSARESVLTAFYTPPVVISAIYKAMEQMGFREGNILEPSCGIGHFIGMLPEGMRSSRMYGVEIDTISAGIAQQLYQRTSIAPQPFEQANIPDSFFDAVVGNVPFGDFRVSDKRYDKNKFLIHDYFFAKSLDKLRPGGVMALITSKGTMDKESPAVRKYIAQRADLIGAIRLPNNTFKGNAGTEVVSDILILQKRDRLIDIEPDWVHLDTDENGVKMNSYFVQHPEMVLGEMKMVSGRFGLESTCEPYDGADLESQLAEAVSNIHGEISDYEIDEELAEEDTSIPADPSVRNFSFTIYADKIYFRENSRMTLVDVSATAENRIKGLIAIRDSVRALIELQTEDYPDEYIQREQAHLNELYDAFTKKYGLINSRGNVSAFSQDSSFSLLSALEVIGEDGELERKADMFFKRTIKPHTPVTSVDTASEALAVSMGEKARVDMEYMCELTGKAENEIYQELKGVIFLNPLYGYGSEASPKYLMADEYLSGNVREKLIVAKRSAEVYPEDYTVNVEALEKVQPKDLTASEIAVRLGATWIPPEVVEQFMYEFLDTPRYAQWRIKVHYSPFTSEWNIENKSYDTSNIKVFNTYGTSRINAYKIIEETLNLKDVRIFDYIEDEEGRKKPVLSVIILGVLFGALSMVWWTFSSSYT